MCAPWRLARAHSHPLTDGAVGPRCRQLITQAAERESFRSELTGEVAAYSAGYLIASILLIVATQPASRAHMQALLQKVDIFGTARAAADVAALTGSLSAHDALGLARRTFVMLPSAELEERDLCPNTKALGPSEQGERCLYHHTLPALLGQVDVFVSHLWRDDPTEKWVALDRFVTHFARKNGRDPTLWLE
jgi:hypothetical protein